MTVAVQKPSFIPDFRSVDVGHFITRHALIVFLGVRVGAFLLLAGLVGIAQLLQ
jgi:hypothetical protein